MGFYEMEIHVYSIIEKKNNNLTLKNKTSVQKNLRRRHKTDCGVLLEIILSL